MRKKSTRESKEVRTTAILFAARAEFEKLGYERAKVANIAKQAGVVEGTVFSYYPTKRALVIAVMEQFYDEINHTINSGIADIVGLEKQLHFVIWNHLNIVSSNQALCAVIIRESRGLDAALSAQVQRLNKDYTAVVGKIISDAFENGELSKPASINLVRNTLFGTIEHYLWDLIANKTSLDVDQVALQITESIVQGVLQSNMRR